jgi:hypothetical protein
MQPLQGITVVALEHADRGAVLPRASWPTWARA